METSPIVGSELEALLPQRFPFLFVDRIDHYELGVSVKGAKNVAKREPLLVPLGDDYWPEAFVVESLGQLAIALFNLNTTNATPPKILLGGVSEVEFHSAFPMGCKIDLYVNVDKHLEDSFIISGYAEVDNERKLTMGALVAKIVVE